MYVILDIETTGGKFNEEGITEIAIHKYDGHQIVDSFISLINPEKPIQPFVVNLTGINNKMLRNAPKFYEVAKRIVEISKDCVLVAHNTEFDYRILRTEFERLGFKFERPTLCTVELSRKLIPDQLSYSLGKLCRSLGIPMSDRHRANGDALATVKLFKLLLEKDADKIIIKSTIKSGKVKELAPKLTNLLNQIPSSSGVFYIHQRNGNIIYIGKGKNLKKVVNQLFLKTSKRAKLIQKLLVSITFDETGNELISNLKYHQEINANKPKFNSRQRNNIPSVTFSHENMLIVDKGRHLDEHSVILIENNEVKGYCFVDLAHQLNHLEIIKQLISPINNSLQTKYIVKNHLQKKKVEKIIRF